MDRDANYIAVGAFVLLVIAMTVGFVLWYTERDERRDYTRYEINFSGSVSGLSKGGPVRYLGVDVGRVVRIGLDPDQQERVQVVADIDASAPIDGRTLASLKLQGVTGLLFVDLERDRNAKTLELKKGHLYPVINSVPSDFDVLLASLPDLAQRASEVLNHLNELIDEPSIQSFHATLSNVRRASDQLPGVMNATATLVSDLRRASARVETTASSLGALADETRPDLNIAMRRLRDMADHLATTSERLDKLVAGNQDQVARFTGDALPQLQRLLRESREAAREFRDLSRSLKHNPSQLIYEPRAGGVEIER
jgi:phospholipid/cholesterol/gamma-HCH transport system substrate-binding protein